MSFINKKESVIDLQLTSYGKTKLAEGKFNPVSYSFEDDDVLYDARCAGAEESQNAVQGRVFENLCPEAFNTVGSETNIGKMKKINDFRYVYPYDEDYHSTLADSQIGTNYIPAWNLKALYGEFTGSITYVTSSTLYMGVPRLSSEIIYKTHVEKGEPPENGMEIDAPRLIDAGIETVYSDGTYIAIDEDFLLLEIFEANTDFEKENFEIEVFQINEAVDTKISGSRTELIPMSFVKIGVDVPIERRVMEEDLNIDSSCVDYFFDVLVDEEITPEISAKYMKNTKRWGYYADKDGLRKEIDRKTTDELYKIDNTDIEDCE